MIIQPIENFKSLGMGHELPSLDKNKHYKATKATNQPDWEEKGKVFVSFNNHEKEPTILLDHFDYKIIKP